MSSHEGGPARPGPDDERAQDTMEVAPGHLREATVPQVEIPHAEPDRRIRTTSASLIRGGMWTTFANVVPQFYTIALSVATARILGPVLTGQQSYISFIMSAVVVVVSLGLPLTLQRFMSNSLGAGDVGQVRSLASWALRLGALLGVIGFGVVTAMQLITDRELGLAWLYAGIATGFVILHHFISQSLFAQQQFRTVSIFGLATGLLTVALTLAALFLGYGINGFFLAGIVPVAISFVGTLWLARRALRGLGDGAPSRRALPAGMLGFGAAAYGADLVDFMLNRRSEFFFLKAWSSPEEIAIYSIGFAAVSAVAQVPTAFTTVVLPGVAALAGAGEHEKVRSGYRTATRLILHVTIPLGALAAVFGPIAIRLVFGQDYAAAGPLVLLMLPISLVLVPIATIALATLTGIGRVRVAMLCGLAALAVNLVLDVLLIRPFGALGAAGANAGGQLVAAILALVVAGRVLRVVWWTGRLLRTLAAALALGAVGYASLWLEPVVGGWVAMGVGILTSTAVYGFVASVLRPIGASESGPLVAALSGRLGRVGAAAARISERPRA